MARDSSGPGAGQRGRVARLEVKEGAYLTDGTRLVEVRRVTGDHVVIEEGNVDAPDISTLTSKELAEGGWRTVEWAPITEEAA